MGIKIPAACELDHARIRRLAKRTVMLIHDEVGNDLLSAYATARLVYISLEEIFIEAYGQEEYDKLSIQLESE